jgi:hypothetical protein
MSCKDSGGQELQDREDEGFGAKILIPLVNFLINFHVDEELGILERHGKLQGR